MSATITIPVPNGVMQLSGIGVFPASIPGRSGRRMEVNKDYGRVIDVRQKLIAVFRQALGEG